MARQKSRKGRYERITLEVREDLIMQIDQQPMSRRQFIEKAIEERLASMETTTTLNTTLENYLKSDDFKSGVIASTKASWGGSGYSVELFEDGTWRNLWNNSIGNKYESEGVILRLPTFTDDGTYQEAVNGEGLPEGQEPMSEEEYFDLCFSNEQDELAQELRDALNVKSL